MFFQITVELISLRLITSCVFRGASAGPVSLWLRRIRLWRKTGSAPEAHEPSAQNR